MERLTQTPLEKEVMIGMSKIDKIFHDCIADLDKLADTYKPKPKTAMEIRSRIEPSIGDLLRHQLGAIQNPYNQQGLCGLSNMQGQYSQLDLALAGLQFLRSWYKLTLLPLVAPLWRRK